MPVGPQVTTETQPSHQKERGISKRDSNWMKKCQYLLFGLLVFLFFMLVASLILSGTEKAQMDNVSDDIKNIGKQLEEQYLLQLKNNEETPSAKQTIRCEDYRFSGMKETLLLEHDFTNDLFENGVFLSNRWICPQEDGIASPSLSVNSNPFRKTFDPLGSDYFDLGCNDNLKYFCKGQNSFVITNTTKVLKFESQMNGKVYCTPRHGIDCKYDPRVATIIFSTWDDDTLLQNDIWFTNTTIYAVHWKRMSIKKKDYSTRAYVYPIQQRKNSDQQHTFSITYRKSELGFWSAVFTVDERDQLTLFHLGYAQNENFKTLESHKNISIQLVSPKRLRMGFGTASYMQMKHPDKQSLPYFNFNCLEQSKNTAETIFQEIGNTTNIFNQGAKFSIKHVQVTEYQ